jgi:DnaJ-domain-containing protein 1
MLISLVVAVCQREGLHIFCAEAFQQKPPESGGTSDRLMKQFATSFGEVVNPYQILQVPRDAEKSTIKESYRKLMKRYHPDARRHKDILPGKW